MGLDGIGGLDHVVILVEDLDRGADAWRRLGFRLSPRGLHSPQKGTGNHTMMLRDDYLEILAVLRETPMNAIDRAGLADDGEGLDRAAFRAKDAERGIASLRALGIEAEGPQSFSRPVERPDGSTVEAAFRTFEWPPEDAPGGLRLFACEHLTPEAVWLPELADHPNGATAIARLEILTGRPESEAGDLAGLTGGTVETCPDGAFRVRSGPGRADFVFLDPSLLAARYDAVPIVGCRGSGAAALVLRVRDLAAAEHAVAGAVRVSDRLLAVPPSLATGVLLAFEAA